MIPLAMSDADLLRLHAERLREAIRFFERTGLLKSRLPTKTRSRPIRVPYNPCPPTQRRRS